MLGLVARLYNAMVFGTTGVGLVFFYDLLASQYGVRPAWSVSATLQQWAQLLGCASLILGGNSVTRIFGYRILPLWIAFAAGLGVVVGPVEARGALGAACGLGMAMAWRPSLMRLLSFCVPLGGLLWGGLLGPRGLDAVSVLAGLQARYLGALLISLGLLPLFSRRYLATTAAHALALPVAARVYQFVARAPEPHMPLATQAWVLASFVAGTVINLLALITKAK